MSLMRFLRKPNKWEARFLALAEHVAQWSKDPSTKTGAVIVRPDRTVASIGYNGFPRSMQDTEERLNNREDKLDRIIHCEINALLHAAEPVRGYTLYTWPFISCHRCAVQMLQAGLIEFIAPWPTEEQYTRWGDSLTKTIQFYHEAGVTIKLMT